MNELAEVENPMYAYLGAFVEELARNGLKNVVICPGSRSTPLAYAFARNSQIKLWMHLDERSAAFFALGMAKASGLPVALVCTSGTAAANFFPAVVEADYSRVPLLVLTADRPPELREIGAPQAIDQLRMYGVYTRWFMEMALPEASNEMLRYVRTVAGRAFATAANAPAGVVHLNFPLREPLVPAPISGQPLHPLGQRDVIAWHGREDGKPYVRAAQVQVSLNPSQIALTEKRRGLIICGSTSQFNPEFNQAIGQLSARLGWPILADPLSGLRHLPEQGLVIDNYDAFLRNPALVQKLAPDFVLRFGAMPTSKPLLLFLKQYPAIESWVVDNGNNWQDPTALASRMWQIDPIAFCKAIQTETNTDYSWLESWQSAAKLTARAIEQVMNETSELSEPKVFAELSQILPENSTLYVGNSMPVRDLDTFFRNRPQAVKIFGNRGANGIDGLVSSALGAAAADQTSPMVLILGDISFYHDMNGLLAAKQHKINATIIVLNNDGGGIFSFLPQANFPDNFEQLFGTPHGLDFEPVSQIYGASWQRVQNWAEFREAVKSATQSEGLHLIEVPTNRDLNVKQHRTIWEAMHQVLNVEV